MCARYTMRLSAGQVRDLFNVDEVPELEPRYNVAPTQEMPVIVANRDGGRSVRFMRWGLVPYWAKDTSIGQRLINAKSETAFEKPAFKGAAEKRRCLVPADGFIEWTDVPVVEQGLFADLQPSKTRTRKQPFHITLKSGQPFAMAGLYEGWAQPNGGRLETYSILTCPANELVGELHDRMPVILLPEDFERWLDRSIQSLGQVAPMMQPLPNELMSSRAVNPLVGNPRFDSPELLDDANPSVSSS